MVTLSEAEAVPQLACFPALRGAGDRHLRRAHAARGAVHAVPQAPVSQLLCCGTGPCCAPDALPAVCLSSHKCLMQ